MGYLRTEYFNVIPELAFACSEYGSFGKIQKRNEITFFINVSVFQVSTPLKNAFVEVAESNKNTKE